MTKLSKVLFIVWIMLAIGAFIGSWYITIPVLKVIGIVSGILNISIILAWMAALVQGSREAKKFNNELNSEE